MRGRFRKQPSQLDAIYAGALDRSVLGIDWNIQKPIDVMLAARNVRINQDRKGRFKPLRDDAGDDLRALVETSPPQPNQRRLVAESGGGIQPVSPNGYCDHRSRRNS
jgi:hypothetical protein